MITPYYESKEMQSFSFAHWIYVRNLVFTALVVLELFTIVLRKCRHYIPVPRFQTIKKNLNWCHCTALWDLVGSKIRMSHLWPIDYYYTLIT